MDNIEIISQEEFAEYDNIKVASYMIDKIKRRGKLFFRQRALINSINKVVVEFNPEEKIEAYITGRDIKSSTARVGIAYFGPKYAAMDLGDWGANVTVIKTSERLVLLSTNKYGEYLKHVFVNTVDPIEMYVTPKGCRMSVELDSGGIKLLEVNPERLDVFREALGDYRYTVKDKMIKQEGKYFLIGLLYYP